MLQFEHVLFEQKEQVAYITLNNPDHLNPLTVEVMGCLTECFEYCEKSDMVRAVVLRGAGGNFSGGGNVKKMKERLDNNINETKKGIRAGGECIMRLKTLSKPTIAWIEGAVAGAGVSLAMACDFSLAQEEAKFVMAFVNIGYVPDGGLVYMLHKAVGAPKAKELLMGGKPFTGLQARAWGIITDAVPKETLETTVEKYIRKYANGPTVAYGQIKRLIYQSVYDGLNNCMQNEVEAQYICSLSKDHREAVNAFIEKRKPNFTGQ